MRAFGDSFGDSFGESFGVEGEAPQPPPAVLTSDGPWRLIPADLPRPRKPAAPPPIRWPGDADYPPRRLAPAPVARPERDDLVVMAGLVIPAALAIPAAVPRGTKAPPDGELDDQAAIAVLLLG